MSDDIGDIAHYYDANGEAEHARLDAHQLEYDLTWRYLEHFLPPRGRILEVGCATGRYTLELARRGYELTSVDLSPGLLQACRANLTAAGLDGRVQLVEADARNLEAVVRTDFDAVLVMGPLYHLIVEADRVQALREAHTRLRSGGLIVSAWLCRYGVLADLLKHSPGWIDDQLHVASLLTFGKRPDSHPRGGFRGYSARPAELAPLHEGAGFATLALAGVEPCIGADDDVYNRLSGKQREQWLDVLFQVSAEPSIMGSSRHLLYVGRK
jgi:SAM-dependent methyltransferase